MSLPHLLSLDDLSGFASPCEWYQPIGGGGGGGGSLLNQTTRFCSFLKANHVVTVKLLFLNALCRLSFQLKMKCDPPPPLLLSPPLLSPHFIFKDYSSFEYNI